jgi:hypothetical protein
MEFIDILINTIIVSFVVLVPLTMTKKGKKVFVSISDIGINVLAVILGLGYLLWIGIAVLIAAGMIFSGIFSKGSHYEYCEEYPYDDDCAIPQ